MWANFNVLPHRLCIRSNLGQNTTDPVGKLPRPLPSFGHHRPVYMFQRRPEHHGFCMKVTPSAAFVWASQPQPSHTSPCLRPNLSQNTTDPVGKLPRPLPSFGHHRPVYTSQPQPEHHGSCRKFTPSAAFFRASQARVYVPTSARTPRILYESYPVRCLRSGIADATFSHRPVYTFQPRPEHHGSCRKELTCLKRILLYL